MKFKKIALLASTLLLSTTLVACGDSEGSNGTKDPKTAAKEKETATLGYTDLLAKDIPWITENSLTLSETSRTYIDKNEALFSAKKKSDIAKLKKKEDTTITSKHLNKNVKPYLEKVVSFKGTVISVEENTERDEPFSYVHVYDEAGQSYSYLTYQTTGDILEEDTVQFWGVPLGVYSFENVSGGATNAIAIFGGTIEKVQ